MKITINSKNLLIATQKVGECIRGNHQLPILSCVLFKSTGNGLLELMASNLEITALTQTAATIEGKVNVCIDYAILIGIIKNLPNGPLEITFKDNKAILELNSSKYEIHTFKGEEYPDAAVVAHDNTIKVKNSQITNAMNKAVKFTNNDQLTQFFNVNINSDGEFLRVAATDAHKLYEETITECNQTFSLLIPNSAINYLSKEPLDAEEIEVSYSKSMISFKDKDTVIDVTLTDATYPRYQGIIPQGKGTTICTVNRKELLGRITNLSTIYSGAKDGLIRMDIKKNEITITTFNDFFNNKGKEVVLHQLEGKEMVIGFNAAVFKEILNAVDLEEIELNLTEPNRAGYIYTGKIKTLSMPVGIPA